MNCVFYLEHPNALRSWIAEISEVVGPVLFLLSDSSSMVTGALLPIDGGMTV